GPPDRGQRDFGGLEELVHFLSCLLSIFTASPSAMLRTELYGPVITWSPGLSPERISKYLSPAIPILIGMNSTVFALSPRMTNTPSTSLRVSPGLSSAAIPTGSSVLPAEDEPRRRRLSFASRTTCPFASYVISRTATDGMGTAATFLRVAVVMSAVQVK